MSILYLALLAAAVAENERRTNAHRASSQRNERQGNTYEAELNDYYERSMDLENFLEAVLLNNAEASKLFLLLENCHNQVDQEDIDSAEAQLQIACEKSYHQTLLLQNTIEKLTSTGITLDDTITSNGVYSGVKQRNEEYSYKTIWHKMGFNGMTLTKEILAQDNNHFEIELEEFLKENPNLEEQLSEIRTKIEKQKRKLKYNPFNKAKNQELLQSMLNLEKEIVIRIARKTRLKNQSQNFTALTEPQKKAVIAYLEEIEKCAVLGNEINQATRYLSKLKYEIEDRKFFDHYRTLTLNGPRNIVNRIIEKAVSQSNFSKEDIERIIEEIKMIMDTNKFSFDRYNKITNEPYHHPTTPESMYAAYFYEAYYQEKQKQKK